MKRIYSTKSSWLMILFLMFASVTAWGQTETVLENTLRTQALVNSWNPVSVSYESATSGYARFTDINSSLTTPSFDGSNYSSISITMSVAKYGSGGNGPITVLYSLDGGSTWKNGGDSGIPTDKEYIESTVTVNETSSTMAIRFTRTNSPSEKRLRDVVIEGELLSGPTLTATPTSLSGFEQTLGTVPSEVQTFTLSGSNLDTTSVDLVSSDGFEISENNVVFGEELSFTTTTGDLEKLIYVRLNGTDANPAITSSILIEGGGFEDLLEVELSGIINPAPSTDPILTVTPAELSGFSHYLGFGPSEVQSFVLSGANLDGTAITLMTDSGFEISIDNVEFSEEIEITSTEIFSETIFVQLNGTTVGSTNNASILIFGGGDDAGTEVTLSGEVLALPTEPFMLEDDLEGQVGVAFTYEIAYDGEPITFTVTEGDFPAGLTLSNTGVISGTPTAAGEYLFEVTATDEYNQSGVGLFIIDIAKGTQTATLENLSLAIGGADVTLPELTEQGFTINYTSSNENVASIIGNTLTIGNAGTATITASNDGDENYEAFSTTFEVSVMDIYGGVGTFVLINSLDELTDGYYVMAYEDKAMSTTLSGGKLESTTIVVDNNTIVNPDLSIVWKIETNGTKKTIQNELIDRYVNYVSSTNLSLENILTDNSNWTVSMANGGFLFRNVTDVNRAILYRISQDAFRGYSTTNLTNNNSNDYKTLDLYKLVSSSAIIWDGFAWSNGEGPTASDDVIIEGALELTEDLAVNNISVTTGSIVVTSGNTLTVNGNIETNAASSFVVENDANLIQTSETANLGEITVVRNSTDMVRLDYAMWSSPVAGQNVQGFSPDTLPTRIYTYEGEEGYEVVANPATATMEVAKGYLYRAPNTWWENDAPLPAQPYIGSFVGTPNNGNISINVHANSYTSIGNPYPSNINSEAFLLQNSGVNTLYFWTNRFPADGNGGYTGDNYVSCNILGCSNDNGVIMNEMITVGQGFIVEATSSEVNFSNDMRTSANGYFLKAEDAQKHRFWLNFSEENQAVHNQILIGYMTGATNGVDTQIDAKPFDYNGTALYSLIDDENYVIQGRALPFETSDVVALGFIAEANKSYTIELANFDGLFAEEEVTVFLKDKELGIVHNLMESAYTFEANESENKTRFEVVYETEGEMNVSDLNNSELVIYAIGQNVYVKSKSENIQSVQLFDIQGRNIHSNAKVNAVQYELATIAKGVVVVKVETANGQVVTKKVIVK